jgi:4-amino-4-deoxy-L-arabinose transferase-like glycosyltransferase
MKFWTKIIFVLLLAVFVYLRIDPILNHTVPYTYDQGRDFQKAMEMLDAKRPTFIGPTTGIMGLFHGAWWYYLLAIPGLLTNGLPVGFYYFMLGLSIVGNVWFFLFLKKKFNDLTALLYLSIVSISPYFVHLGFTASNNIIVPYLVMSLIVLAYKLFQNKQKKWLYLLLGLNLSFILEFEVAFGLLLAPVFFLMAIVFKPVRKQIYNIKNLGLVLAGMLVPIIPRALFEIKNNFMQTKTLLGFFTNPKLHNPSPFKKMVADRIDLFVEYARGIPYEYSAVIAGLMAIFTIVVLFKRRKNNKMVGFTTYLATLMVFLFGISLMYKDNFWFNYYEGIQYVLLTLFLLAFYLLSKWNKNISYVIFALFLVINVLALNKYNSSKTVARIEGLAETEATFEYIHSKTGKNDYCLRIHTPPAIPHTYVYMMNWKARTQGYKISTYDFRNNECYFIVESDPYDFRVKKWREDNTPDGARLIEKKVLTGNVVIEKWALK